MECKINFLENSKGFYEPGQKLKVEVLINLAKSEKINRISCVITGIAKCRWNEDTANGAQNATNRGRENFIKEEFLLLENHNELTAGSHSFKVNYILSSHLPTSFKCRNGSIKYKCRIIVERPWKINSHFDFPFIVIRPRNLNNERSILRNPITRELTKDFMLDFTTQPLHMSARIPFTGYVPGQTIDVSVRVNNQSKTYVKELKISLKKIVLLTSDDPRRNKQIVVSEARVSAGSVSVQTVREFEEKLTIPSLPPNIDNCNVIRVSYELRVKAKTSGLNRSPKLKLPITIGTVPLECRENGIPRSASISVILPPSYEDAMRDAPSCGSSESENSFNPRYPVYTFAEVDENVDSSA